MSSDARCLEVFPQYLSTLAADAVAISAVLAAPQTPDAARRALAGGLNYLFKTLDLIPDGLDDIGYIDDAFVLRFAAQRALASDPPVEPSHAPLLQRLATEVALINGFLGELAPPFFAYVVSLDHSTARGRSVDEVLANERVRADLASDIASFARSYNVPAFAAEPRTLQKLRSFLQTKLPR